MYFDNLHDLLYMNGHGVYVWTVYGVAILLLGSLAVAPMIRRRRFIREERQRLRREHGT